MFEYQYTVKSSDGLEWGLFKTKGVAQLLRDALEDNFGNNFGRTFYVELIK